jgi:fructose-1,6-bisphosphatase/inositol monophosphatase family enzyme
VRSLGGCVDAMMVCSGYAEAWIELHAHPWDLAPLKVIGEEAGARFLNFDGGSTIYGGNVALFVPPLEPAIHSLIGAAAAV